MLQKDRLTVGIVDQLGKWFIDQRLSSNTKKLRTSKIGFANYSNIIQGEVTDGGKVIKLCMLVARSLNLVRSQLQIGIAHLQLDLVDLQFVVE